MADIPSFDTLFRVARDEALYRSERLTKEAVERDGSDANIMLAGAAAVGDEVSGLLGQVSSGMFLGSARGTMLDRVVFDRYGLRRKSASPAYGSVYFHTTAPNPATFVIPVGTTLSTAGGVQYVTTAAAVFALGLTTCGPIAVRSVLAGIAQQASIGEIANITSAISGQPSDLAVTNTLATAGADEDEADDAYVARARAYFPSLRRGTLAAIEAGALNVPGVRKAQALEVLDLSGRPARYVWLAISDAYTDALAQLTSTVPSYQAQSQVFSQTVFANLSDVRAAGIYVQVYVAQVVMQPVTLSLSFSAGVDIEAVALAARATVCNYINTMPPGTALDPATLLDQLRSLSGLVITGNEITTPSGVVVARPIQAIRTSLNIVTAGAISTGTSLVVSSNPDAYVFAP
jgi:hypothetical protein